MENEDISKKIQPIQTDTQSAVTAIGEISAVIGQIGGISNTIASTVEEQSELSKPAKELQDIVSTNQACGSTQQWLT